jgi:hypothetical protein
MHTLIRRQSQSVFYLLQPHRGLLKINKAVTVTCLLLRVFFPDVNRLEINGKESPHFLPDFIRPSHLRCVFRGNFSLEFTTSTSKEPALIRLYENYGSLGHKYILSKINCHPPHFHRTYVNNSAFGTRSVPQALLLK